MCVAFWSQKAPFLITSQKVVKWMWLTIQGKGSAGSDTAYLCLAVWSINIVRFVRLEVNTSSCKTVILWMFVWSSFRCLISNTVECKQSWCWCGCRSSLESGAVYCAEYGTFSWHLGIEFACPVLDKACFGVQSLVFFVRLWNRKLMKLGRVLEPNRRWD